MARSNFGRPGLFAPRNLIAVGAVVVVVLGAFLLLRTMDNADPAPPAPAPPPEVVVEAEPTPPPEEAPAQPEPPPEPTFPTVLVAAQDIRPGVLLTAEMVEWQEWREEALDVGFAVVKEAVDMRQVLGSVALHAIEKGALVSFDRVIRPGHPAFITAVWRPGRRAFTV